LRAWLAPPQTAASSEVSGEQVLAEALHMTRDIFEAMGEAMAAAMQADQREWLGSLPVLQYMHAEPSTALGRKCGRSAWPRRHGPAVVATCASGAGQQQSEQRTLDKS
jgi:hypothetical protein